MIEDKDFKIVSNFQGEEDEFEQPETEKVDIVNIEIDFTKSGIYVMDTTKSKNIERSFSDFSLLRKALVQNFPGCYIPKIPEKRAGVESITQSKEESSELKRTQLEDFCSKLWSISHLSTSDIFKSFTNSNANVTKTLKRYLNPTKKQILDRYKEVFFNLYDKEINADLITKIEKFNESLKQRLPVLRKFRNAIRRNIDGFRSSYSKICDLMTSLGQFEEVFLDYTKDIAQYEDANRSNSFSDNYGSRFGVFQELQTDQNCPYYELDAFINNDIADYEAFLEAIKTQEQYLSDRKSIRSQLDKLIQQFNSFDFSSAKDDRVRKIQIKIESLEIEFNEMDIIWNIMLVAMGYYEIERFEIEKYRLYWESVAKFSKQETANEIEILGFYQYLKNLSNISAKSMKN